MPRRVTKTIKQTFFSLRSRNFRLFFIGQSISNSGNWLTNVALTLLVLHLTGSGLAVGLLTACQFGPILLLSAWGGAIADRYNKRNLLFITQSLEMLQSVALAALAFTHNPPIWAFFVLAGLGGTVLAFDNPLRRSFVTEMVPEEDIPNAVVLYSTIINVARIIGPALAGALIVAVGYGWCFMVDALSYLAVLGCLWLMRPSELRLAPDRPAAKGLVRAGIRYVLAVPVLWITFAMLLVIGSFAYNFTVTLPLLVTKTLHGSTGSFTLVYSTFGVGAFCGALLTAHRRLVSVRHVVSGAMAMGVTMFIIAFSPAVAVLMPVAFILGITSIIYMTASTSLVQVSAKPSMHGRVLALQTVLLVGTTPVGGPLLGWLADTAGARTPIAIGGIACIAASLFGYLAAKKFNTA